MTRLIESRRVFSPPSTSGGLLRSADTTWRLSPVFTATRDTFGRRSLPAYALAVSCTQTALNSVSASGLVIPYSTKRGASPSNAAFATLKTLVFQDSPLRSAGRLLCALSKCEYSPSCDKACAPPRRRLDTAAASRTVCDLDFVASVRRWRAKAHPRSVPGNRRV